jgi:hypothetical protein
LRTNPSYPAARSIAPKVRAHFARHAKATHQPGAPLPLLPDTDAIEAIVDAAFWASLRREEGYVPRISLALLEPSQAAHPLMFERPIPLAPASLVRIAPAVERRGIHLGVWQNGELLEVWGTTWLIPSSCFVLEVVAPGLLVVKHNRDGAGGKFVNVAVLEGDQIKIIDERASALPDCPVFVTSLLGFDAGGKNGGAVDVLVQLAVSMRTHGRGGTLLVVPSDSDAWRESIVRPVAYSVLPPFSDFAEIVREIRSDPESVRWQEALDEAVSAVAGLTAVDGATVLTDRYELLAFGAKIARRDGSSPVERVALTEPVEGGTPAVVHPNTLGGTRHLSAVQFVHDQHDAMALVASQDGHFTVFAWSPCEEIVHAHRVETLLL